MTHQSDFENSSGNVFADLNIPDAEEALTKSSLAHLVASLIEKKKFSQAEAAKLLAINQTKLSTLLRGKLTGVSTEQLFRFLNALGCDVEIVIKRSRRGQAGVVVIAP